MPESKVLDLPAESVSIKEAFMFEGSDGKVRGTKITNRYNTVLAECEAGVYVGNTEAGVTLPHSVRLVRWRKESD